MTTPTTRAEKIAGLILLIAIVGWGAGLVARSRTQDWFHLRPLLGFELEETHGLAEGARVRMSGVPVGSVRSVVLTDRESVMVSLEILPEHAGRLRGGLRAEVVPPSFLGGTEVSLIPGDGSTALPMGSVIPVEVKPDTQKTFASLMPKLVALGDDLTAITGALRSGDGSLGKLLNDGGELHESLSALLEDARKTMGRYRTLGDETTAAIEDLRTLVPRLHEEVDLIGEVIAGMSKNVDKLNEILTGLGDREEGIPDLLERTRLVMTEVRDAIRLVAEEVPPTAESARYTSNEARRLIRATERNFLIRPYMEPLPAAETAVPGSRRWDPYQD